jgi:hypothetical protein
MSLMSATVFQQLNDQPNEAGSWARPGEHADQYSPVTGPFR